MVRHGQPVDRSWSASWLFMVGHGRPVDRSLPADHSRSASFSQMWEWHTMYIIYMYIHNIHRVFHFIQQTTLIKMFPEYMRKRIVIACFKLIYCISKYLRDKKNALENEGCSIQFRRQLFTSTVHISNENSNIIYTSFSNSKGRFTRCDFVACNLLTTRLRQKKVVLLKTCFKTLRQSWPKMCRKHVVRRSHATKLYRVNRP